MTNYLKIDVKKMTLVYDRAFAKNCFIVGTAEYAQLQDAMKTFPNFKLEQRSIKKNAKKECYKGLNYEYMREYITCHEEKEDREAVLAELEEMIVISKCHSVAYRYSQGLQQEVIGLGDSPSPPFFISLLLVHQRHTQSNQKVGIPRERKECPLFSKTQAPHV